MNCGNRQTPSRTRRSAASSHLEPARDRRTLSECTSLPCARTSSKGWPNMAAHAPPGLGKWPRGHFVDWRPRPPETRPRRRGGPRAPAKAHHGAHRCPYQHTAPRARRPRPAHRRLHRPGILTLAVSVAAVGLEEGKEENCCTGRGATRLNLKGQTATMTGSVRMPLMKGERMQHLLTYRAWHVLWWHTV